MYLKAILPAHTVSHQGTSEPHMLGVGWRFEGPELKVEVRLRLSVGNTNANYPLVTARDAGPAIRSLSSRARSAGLRDGSAPGTGSPMPRRV
jgi:hypothetical protein